MTCECHGGPEDGGTQELPDTIQPGFVHGILSERYVSDHPFVGLSETPLVACPQVVVYYRYSLDPLKKVGGLHFIGYRPCA